MITYERFWETLKERKISTYALIHQYHFSSGKIDRLRKNLPISTITMNDLCRILDCKIEDIAEYTPSDLDQEL